MKIIRRKRPPPKAKAWNVAGVKTPDAPANWPFGTAPVPAPKPRPGRRVPIPKFRGEDL